MKSFSSHRCSFCGVPSRDLAHQGGEWHTNGGTVYCCHRCAVDVLPRFMADSVAVRQNSYVEGGKALERANGNFWKAMTARLSSRGGE